MSKPRLLDLFCKAGGCTRGYQQAGFEVVGVDIQPQPRYCGNAFILGDALEVMAILLSGGYVADIIGHKWYLSDFDAFGASPPCQAYSVTASLPNVHTDDYPKLIPQIRELLQATKKPYAIENVPGAPLNEPVVLNGHHFGLKTIRCRWFETNPWFMSPGFVKPKNITTRSFRAYSSFENGATHITVAGHNFKRADAAIAMGINWMNRAELAEAIPPAFTQYIGRHLMEVLR